MPKISHVWIVEVSRRSILRRVTCTMHNAFLISAIALLVSRGFCYAQDLAAGETQFKACAICHDIGAGAKNKIGPALNGLDGRKSGTVPNFKYSQANKNSGIIWDETQFLDYIKDPKAKIPGTIMVFPGIKNEAAAKNLWAYLKQFDADGNKK
jgi:cytochrome c